MEESSRNQFDSLVAPNREDQEKIREFIKNCVYYGLIGVISLVAMLIVPFFAGSVQGDFKLYFPQSTIGWIVYWIIRGGSACLNVAIFALFKLQAKVNIKTDANYLKAKEILHKSKNKQVKKPRSPSKMEFQEWTVKGLTILVTSLLAGCTLSALILEFDSVTFLSCFTTVICGLVFGYVTMKKNEVYWTEEYLEYAEWVSAEGEKNVSIK